jgi:large subunit ribosomal protein L6
MSRVGKQPVALPKEVTAEVKEDKVSMKGPKGSLSMSLGKGVKVSSEAGNLLVAMIGSDAQAKANWGTTRAKLNNMVKGVTVGWKRTLEMNGVGFTAKLAGQNLTLAVGFSHDVTVVLPKEIKCTVTKNVIDLESVDRELVGTFAAKIRKVQPPEPYLGKGIKYAEEKIRRKAGKTGKK